MSVNRSQSDWQRGATAFVSSAAIVALVWLVVLPWIAARPAVRARTAALKERGIDPAALFYTDLEAMPRLEARLAAQRRKHPEAFWQIGWSLDSADRHEVDSH